MELPPEEILKRWFNYHLQRAGSKRVVNNFSDDLKVISFSFSLSLFFFLSFISRLFVVVQSWK
jgi:hypothetical protein